MNHGTCSLENMMNHGCGPLTERTPNIEYPAIGTSSRSPTSGQWRSQRQKDERKRIQQIRLEDRLSPMRYLCLKITLVKRKKKLIYHLFILQAKWFLWRRKWWAEVPVGTRVALPACRATSDSNRRRCVNAKAKFTAKVFGYYLFSLQMKCNNNFSFQAVMANSLDLKAMGSD